MPIAKIAAYLMLAMLSFSCKGNHESEVEKDSRLRLSGAMRWEIYKQQPGEGFCSYKLVVSDPSERMVLASAFSKSADEDSEVMPCGYGVLIHLIFPGDTNTIRINPECGYMSDQKGMLGRWRLYKGQIDRYLENIGSTGTKDPLCLDG